MKKDWMIKESELDDDQIKVLTATLDKSCVISGCAGSGKSVLALIKAQRIQKERGDNYEIIVYKGGKRLKRIECLEYLTSPVHYIEFKDGILYIQIS